MNKLSLTGIVLGAAINFSATTSQAEMIYVIDRATSELVLLHPSVQQPIARIAIDFSGVSTNAAASVQAGSGFDLTFANNRIYALKYVPPPANTPSAINSSSNYLFDINIFNGDVSKFAQVVDTSGAPITNAAEGLAYDGTDVLIGYYSGGAGSTWSESNTVEVIDTTASFGQITTSNGYHNGQDLVDTDGFAACGDQMIGVDNDDNGVNGGQIMIGIYDMGTQGNTQYTPAGLLPNTGNFGVQDLDFLADGRIAVITNDPAAEIKIYDDLQAALPSTSIDLPAGDYDGIAVFKCGCDWVCGPVIQSD